MRIPANEIKVGDIILSPGFAITAWQVTETDTRVEVKADEFTLSYLPDELVEVA